MVRPIDIRDAQINKLIILRDGIEAKSEMYCELILEELHMKRPNYARVKKLISMREAFDMLRRDVETIAKIA